MLWIIGLDTLFRALAHTTNHPALVWWGKQMHHVSWDGLRAYDLIFPIFVFVSGVAIPYALKNKQDRGISRKKLTIQTFKRVAILILLGLLYNGLLDFKGDQTRFASVLGTIGIAYGTAALVFLFTRSFRARCLWTGGILLAVAALQLLVPVPGHGAGQFTPDGIINAWIDQQWLPGHLYGGSFDPEGWLCAFSAGFLALLGCLCGEQLRNRAVPQFKSVIQLLLGGGLLISLGALCWHLGYPPIKAAWTSSFNLLAGGIAMILLGIFHLGIDFKPRPDWSLPLQIVGMNPLTIYLICRIVPMASVSGFFFGGVGRLSSTWEPVVLALGILVVEFILLVFLYRKRIFLRI